MTQHQRDANPHPSYNSAASYTTALPVCCVVHCNSKILLYIETTDYRSNFAKTILFKNCFCFGKNSFSISVESPRIFQSLISIPAGH